METADKMSALNIRNLDSDFCMFYELNSRYMLVLEEFSYTHDYVNYSLLSPNSFTKWEGKLSSSIFSKDRTLHQHNFFEIMFVLQGNCIHRRYFI